MCEAQCNIYFLWLECAVQFKTESFYYANLKMEETAFKTS